MLTEFPSIDQESTEMEDLDSHKNLTKFNKLEPCFDLG